MVKVAMVAKRQPKPVPPRKKFSELSIQAGLNGLETFHGLNIEPTQREAWRRLPMGLRPLADQMLYERLKRYPPEKHRYLKGLIMANIVSHLRGNRDPVRARAMLKTTGLRRYQKLVEMGLVKYGEKIRPSGEN